MYKRILLLSAVVTSSVFAANQSQSIQSDLNGMLNSFPQLRATYYSYLQSKENTKLTKTFGYPSWYVTLTPYNYYYYREEDPASGSSSGFNGRLSSLLGGTSTSSNSDTVYEYNYHYSEADYGVSQVLIDFGRQSASNKISELGTQNFYNSYKSQQDSTMIQGMHAYIQIIESRNIILLCTRVLDSIKQDIKEANNKSPLTKTDIKKAQANIAAIQGVIAKYNSELDSALASYRYFYGHEPKLPLNELRLLKLPKSKLPKSEKSAVKLALAQNLNIISAKNNVASSKESYKQAWSTQFPTLSIRLDGTYSDNANGDSEKIDDYTVSLSANYSTNVFSPYFRIKAAKYGVLSAQESLKNTNTSMQQSAESIWGGLKNFEDRLQANLAQMEAAVNFIEDASEEYKAGKRSLLDLLNAKTQVLSAGIQANKTYNRLVLQSYTMLSLINKLSVSDAQITSKTDLLKTLEKAFPSSASSIEMIKKIRSNNNMES